MFLLFNEKNLIDSEFLKDIKLSRFDLYFFQKINSSKESLLDFFYRCQEKIKVTTNCEINSKGKILKIGDRQSGKYARINLSKRSVFTV